MCGLERRIYRRAVVGVEVSRREDDGKISKKIHTQGL